MRTTTEYLILWKEVKKVKKKVLMLATVVILALLTSSIVVVSQACMSPKPKYVIFDLKLSLNPYAIVNTFTDTSNFPVVVTEGYMGRRRRSTGQCHNKWRAIYLPQGFRLQLYRP